MPVIGIVFVLLGVFSLVNGAWMIASAATWYENLPGAVPDFGAYNGHFIRDIGLAYCISGAGFLWSAYHLRQCRIVVVAQALWAAGHAVLHVIDIVAGRVSGTHWFMDAPGVLLPGLVLGVIALPTVWRVVYKEAGYGPAESTP